MAKSRKREAGKRGGKSAAPAEPSRPPSDGSAPRFHAIAVAVLLLLGALAYANSLSGPFVFDDERNIVQNRAVHWTSLAPANFVGLTRTHEPTRFIAYASFGINHALGGLEPWGYHATNVAIHLATALLVYALALAILGTLARAEEPALLGGSTSHWTALATALLFLLHPLQTQAVTYVVQRMTSLCAFFYLASLLAYVHGRGAESPGRRNALFALGLLLWALALGTKQNAATLPIAILLYEWLVVQKADVDWLKRNAAYGGGAILVLMVVGLALLGNSPFAGLQAAYDHYDFTMGQRLLTEPRVVWFHLSQVLLPLPSRLNLLHDVTPSTSLFAPVTTAASLAGLAALLVLALWLIPRQRLLAFCILWFGLHLVIESSVVALDLIFEHRMYLPMVGVCLGIAWAIFALAPRLPIAVGVTTALSAALAFGTITRNAVWQDAIALWSDTATKSPAIARAHTNLGVAYIGDGRMDDAIAEFETALELAPELERARTNLGNALRERGRHEAALAQYRKVLRRTPSFVPAWLGLGKTFEAQGRPGAALDPYEEAARLAPTNATARIALGVALQGQGRCGDAVPHYRAAIAARPNAVESHNNLAWVLATCPDASARDGQAALAHAERAVALGGGNPAILDSLSAAYAELGNYDQATKWQRQAVERAPAALRSELRSRLALYEAKRPYRDTTPSR